MAISPYIRELRELVGSRRLLMPSVSIHIYDESGRILLVRQREGGEWSTPGGSIEIDERPADAAVREAFEETGLIVSVDRVSCILGGPECVVTYSNGDEVQYVIIGFRCTVIGGDLSEDLDEINGARYVSRDEADRLELAKWLRPNLDRVFAAAQTVSFAPVTWTPSDLLRQ